MCGSSWWWRCSIVVVAMLVGFSALSIYITVSSIYNIGKRRGEQIRIERMRQLELHPGISKDSIHFNHDKKHGREQNGKTAGNGRKRQRRMNAGGRSPNR